MTTQAHIPASVFKVVAFAGVTAVLIGLLGTLIGNIRFEATHTYRADFADATGVFKGDRVRVSGVEVGSVKKIELVPAGNRQLARLSFTVDQSVPVFADARLQLRYENIVGQRYLNISEKAGSRPRMADGGIFSTDQTEPALNLTELFNGFQPLFRALDPERVNKLSYQLVRSLQGEATSLQSLLRNTARLTNTIADRDRVIGSVVANLNAVLKAVGTRDEKLTDLIEKFRDLMSGLAKDRDVIDESLPALASLMESTTGVISEVRPPLKSDIASLRTLAGQVHRDRKTLDKSLKSLPFKERTLARTGSYGSWFNFYVCGLNVRLTLLDNTLQLGGVGVSANERGTVCSGGVG